VAADRLRGALVGAAPPGLSLKAAGLALIRASRRARRRGAAAGWLGGRSALDQALDRPLDPAPGTDPAAALGALGAALRALQGADPDDPSTDATVVGIEAAVASLVALEVDGPVPFSVEGWPPRLGREGLDALVGGADPAGAPPAEVAALARRLDGLELGGGVLRVRPGLPPRRCLPAVPREERADRGRWAHEDPWLPYLDDTGRRSLSPRDVAARQAAWAGGRPVLDACCGCGGNAVAFALAGSRVEAWELDPGRAALARQNARAAGVADRVVVRIGDGLRARPGPGQVLFLDPPWEGDGARDLGWTALAARLPGLDAALGAAGRALLKLPRAFDLGSLPGDGWAAEVALGPGFGRAEGVVRLITAARGLEAPPPR